LTHQQAQCIIAYRAENGGFQSIYELQAVRELPPDVIERLRPFVMVRDPGTTIDRTLIRRIRQESDNYLLMRLSRAWNAEEDGHPYKGGPEHLLVRFRSQRPGDFSFGFNTEKDAGEPLEWNPSTQYYGLDRWTFHAQLQNKGIIKNLIVGDFQAQYGQGLVLGGGFGAGKGAETITTIRRANAGIFPFTSAYESGNLRGAAVTLRLPRALELSLLCSRVRRDASLEEGPDGWGVTSLQRSGLHRTATELAGKRQVKDTQAGIVLTRKWGSWEAGTQFVYSAFDLPLSPNATPYNQFSFRGRSFQNAGLFFSYNTERFSSFGEFALTIDHGLGFVVGVLCVVSKKLDVAVLLRHYEPDYYTRFSNAIGENSSPSNEHGSYLGWRYQFNRRLSFTGYLDLFTFPWLRYRAYSPSSGYEWLARLTYQPSRNVLLYAQAREEMKLRNAPSVSPGYVQETGIKNNYWLHVEVGLREHLRLRTRFQASRFQQGRSVSGGMALSQDVRMNWGHIEVIARYALFDTENYDNRIYSYENDVLLAYSMPAYNGTGIRKMLMMRVALNRHLTLWGRYAETVSTQPEALSPNATTPRYMTDREMRFQLRIQF